MQEEKAGLHVFLVREEMRPDLDEESQPSSTISVQKSVSQLRRPFGRLRERVIKWAMIETVLWSASPANWQIINMH